MVDRAGEDIDERWMLRAFDRLEHMGATEQRALTPLFWGHVNPYGTFRLDITARLPLDLPTAGTVSDQLPLQGV